MLPENIQSLVTTETKPQLFNFEALHNNVKLRMTLTSRSGSLPTAFSSLSALGATVKHDRAAGTTGGLGFLD